MSIISTEQLEELRKLTQRRQLEQDVLPLVNPASSRRFDVNTEIANIRNIREKSKQEKYKRSPFGSNLASIVDNEQPRMSAIEKLKDEGVESTMTGRFVKGAKEGFGAATESAESAKTAFEEGKRGQSFLEATGALFQMGALPIIRGVEGVISPAVETAVGGAGTAISAITPDQIEDPIKREVAEFAQSALDQFNDLDPSTQESLKNLARSAEVLLSVATLGSAPAAKKAVTKGATELVEAAKPGFMAGIETGAAARAALKEGAEETVDVLKTIVNTPVTKTKEFLSFKTADDKIAALIEPKMLKKEKMKAIREGRVTESKAGLFTGKKPDVVLPDEDVLQATETIKRLIPNADKKTQFQLHNDMATKINEIGSTLKGELQEVPVNKDVIAKANDAWEKAREIQLDSTLFAEHQAAGRKIQERFQRFLDTLNNPNATFADIWDARIEYDNITKKAAKQATDDSSTLLQLEKDMWLQNRNILNDILKKESGELSGQVKQDFFDMSNLYNAKENIVSKADVDTRGKEGLIKNVLKWGARGAAAGAAGAAGYQAF
jgi:hypothetical protein